ncbi:MAG: bifunctional D-glycero-beta-D-manno-heptose-7-phosphate kinase/D-glycero-beta-D-manno-heptose 1-phosphate adenylyltransferase HldE, partial [Pseudomonadota bacterium]
LRVLSQHQQLLRLDFEESFAAIDKTAFHKDCETALDSADLLLLSDYGKGTLNDPQRLIQTARQRGLPVLVDPKGLDFQRYRGATLLTPNLAEFEAVAGKIRDDRTLTEAGERMRQTLELSALLITLGERGLLLLEAGRDPLHLPARAREVFDVTGAGDTVIAVLAAGLAGGLTLANAAGLANLAAGLVVAKLGTAAVTPAELRRAQAHHEWRVILTPEELQMAVDEARAQGERIVMTNGCFDILHDGHVAYLEEARRLGDRLVVAVNSDASVRRLKGVDRPINPLARRLAVLAGLSSVDWLTAFEEDTPEALICTVRPDILVKGGDYQVEAVAGHRCVTESGGTVRILGFLPDRSTSRLISAIRAGGANT